MAATKQRLTPARSTLASTLREACPGVAASTLDDFLDRLDPDYFAYFEPHEVCQHMTMAEALDADEPFQARFRRQSDGILGIAIVAFDHFAEFSVLCGLVASFGLEILSGRSFTFALPKQPAPSSRPRLGRRKRPAIPTSSRAKIIDVFEVRPRSGLGKAAQKDLIGELAALETLLAAGELEQARARINRRLLENLAREDAFSKTLAVAAKVSFDDTASDRWTVMDVHSRDTPGFLYAFSSALAMRGIEIHRVHIESRGGQIQDRFYISDRQGQKIDGERERLVLARAVVLIEQFTHFLRRAPDPARAMRYFDQFLDKVFERTPGESAFRVITRQEGLDLLARLLGSSEFLWEELLRNNFASLVPVFERLGSASDPTRDELRGVLVSRLGAARGPDERKRALNDFKDGEMLLIVLQQMRAPRSLTRFSARLTALAEVVIEQALRLTLRQLEESHGQPLNADGRVCPVAACAQGKLGGREVGYASDAELVFVYDGTGWTSGSRPIPVEQFFDRLVRDLVELIEARREGAFRVDLRLRPHGSSGPLACPIDAWRDYYSESGDAAPFERQALIKLRVIAGDEALGRIALQHRDSFVYSGAGWDMEAALHLRRRQALELVPPGRTHLKYSPGGLVDVEYAVQYMQIQHGQENPDLRGPNTLDALRALKRAGLLHVAQQQSLAAAYSFLRRLIDAMRMVKGDAGDLVLPDTGAAEFAFLARRMGYRNADWKECSERLDRDIRREMSVVSTFFTERFGPVVGSS